jgi:hypothetical protein
MTFAVDEEVGRFDVPMNNPELVKGSKTYELMGSLALSGVDSGWQRTSSHM